MEHSTDRRTFIKTSLTAPAALALAAGKASAQAAASPAAASLPTGKLGGKLPVSRLLLGGNLLTHFTHSRDLKYVYDLAAHYNTEAKIIQTLEIAEQNGVNTLVVHTANNVPIIPILRKHRDNGGKIQWIICPTTDPAPGLEAYRKHVDELVGYGTEAVYLWGVQADRMVHAGQTALIGETIEAIKSYGIPAGIGAHDLAVVKECEKAKVANDFYIKTFHHHNYPTAPREDEIKGPVEEIPGYWCKSPQDTIDTMASVEKTWIAFKVMAAGAIEPKNAFRYCFENGADHILAGMFDFEIAQDAQLIRDALTDVKRSRAWRS